MEQVYLLLASGLDLQLGVRIAEFDKMLEHKKTRAIYALYIYKGSMKARGRNMILFDWL